jgi:hypothetical protein
LGAQGAKKKIEKKLAVEGHFFSETEDDSNLLTYVCALC